MNLSSCDESNAVQLTLKKVLYVSNLSKNSLSVPVLVPLTQMGAEVLFGEGRCIISKNERKVTIGYLVDSKLYMVNTDGEAHIASTTSQSLEQWHCHFGHLNYSYTDCLIKGKLVEGMSCSSGEVNRQCEAWHKGKCTESFSPRRVKRKHINPSNLYTVISVA